MIGVEDMLKTMGTIAGIGGLALGVFLLLFREIIRKKIFPTLTKQQAYRTMGLISVLVWSVAVITILAWIFKAPEEHQPVTRDNRPLQDVTRRDDLPNKGAQQFSQSTKTYNVRIKALPTTVNFDASHRPHSTTLELHSRNNIQRIQTLNFPIHRIFTWSPDISGDVILNIGVGDIILTKKYSGRLGFSEFLREFSEGNRIFRPNEFNTTEIKVLKDYGIEFISVSFHFSGANPVIGYLSE